jgi:hypothetical protein
VPPESSSSVYGADIDPAVAHVAATISTALAVTVVIDGATTVDALAAAEVAVTSCAVVVSTPL